MGGVQKAERAKEEERRRREAKKEVKLVQKNYSLILDYWQEKDEKRSLEIKNNPDKFKDLERISNARRWILQSHPPNFYLLNDTEQLIWVLFNGLDNGIPIGIDEIALKLGITSLETGKKFVRAKIL